MSRRARTGEYVKFKAIALMAITILCSAEQSICAEHTAKELNVYLEAKEYILNPYEPIALNVTIRNETKHAIKTPKDWIKRIHFGIIRGSGSVGLSDDWKPGAIDADVKNRPAETMKTIKPEESDNALVIIETFDRHDDSPTFRKGGEYKVYAYASFSYGCTDWYSCIEKRSNYITILVNCIEKTELEDIEQWRLMYDLLPRECVNSPMYFERAEKFISKHSKSRYNVFLVSTILEYKKYYPEMKTIDEDVLNRYRLVIEQTKPWLLNYSPRP